jgi:hypothetical protein
VQRLNIQLDEATYERLRDLSDQTGVSVAEIIRKCVVIGVDQVEAEVIERPEVKARMKRLSGAMLRTLQKSE